MQGKKVGILLLVLVLMTLVPIWYEENNLNPSDLLKTPDTEEKQYFASVSMNLTVSENFDIGGKSHAYSNSEDPFTLIIILFQFSGTINEGKLITISYYYFQDGAAIHTFAISGELLVIYGPGDDKTLLATGVFSSEVPSSFSPLTMDLDSLNTTILDEEVFT